MNQADDGPDGRRKRVTSSQHIQRVCHALAGVTSECGLGVDFKFHLIHLSFLSFYVEETLLK